MLMPPPLPPVGLESIGALLKFEASHFATPNIVDFLSSLDDFLKYKAINNLKRLRDYDGSVNEHTQEEVSRWPRFDTC